MTETPKEIVCCVMQLGWSVSTYLSQCIPTFLAKAIYEPKDKHMCLPLGHLEDFEWDFETKAYMA